MKTEYPIPFYRIVSFEKTDPLKTISVKTNQHPSLEKHIKIRIRCKQKNKSHPVKPILIRTRQETNVTC